MKLIFLAVLACLAYSGHAFSRINKIGIVRLDKDQLERTAMLQSNRIPKRRLIGEDEVNAVNLDDSDSSESDEVVIDPHLNSIETVLGLLSNDQSDVRVQSIDMCDDCQAILIKLKNAAEDEDEMTRIVAEVNAACDELGQDYAPTCRKLANNLPALLQTMKTYLDEPEATCRMMKFCPGNVWTKTVGKLVYMTSKNAYLKRRQGTGLGDIACDECKFVVEELKKELEDQQTQEQIRQALHGACAHLGRYEQKCVELVDAYLDQLIAELDQGLSDPQAVCQEAGLCQGPGNSRLFSMLANPLLPVNFPTRQNLPRIVNQQAPALSAIARVLRKLRTSSGINAVCSMCRSSFTLLEKILQRESESKTIIRATQSFCRTLSRKPRTQCLEFLREYGSSVMTMTMQQLRPDKVCLDVQMCKAEDLRQILGIGEDVRNEVECEACKVMVEYLQTEIRQPEVQTELTQLFEKGCQYLPTQYQSECTQFADNYVQAIIQVITSEEPVQLCQQIHECPASSRRSRATPQDDSNYSESNESIE